MNWVGWVGDQDADFGGLEAALNNMFHSAEYGYLAHESTARTISEWWRGHASFGGA